jgi:beta-glucosidase
MPDDSFFGKALKQAVDNGEVPMTRIDDMVVRILYPMFTMGLFDNPQTGNLSVDARSAAHTELARRLAEVSTVLVQNNANTLPMRGYTTIAVIGDDASKNPIATGEGSGYVIPPYIVTPLQGITRRAGPNVTVTYADSSSVQQAVNNAKAAQIAVVFVATTSSEGTDRPDLGLGAAQDQLVAAVAAAQPNTVVVIHHPGAVLMPWATSVRSIVCAFLPGQEDGNAIAATLYGDINPSGKLPVTFPMTNDQIPVNTKIQYPGINGETEYLERLLVGYRWYDAKNVAPLFPFGHGLSYTTFAYSNLQIVGSLAKGITISINVTNSGDIAGHEVAQLYLGFPSSAGEPPSVLRGFKKHHLHPGQTKVAKFTLIERDVSIWDVDSSAWSVVSGTFNVMVGSSSRDIRAKGTFKI